MFVTLTVAQYKGSKTIFGFLSMAVFRIILFLNKYGMSFYKLMGTGKNGTFDIKPDLNQWAYLWVWNSEGDYRKFLEVSYISKYLKKFTDEFFTIYLSPKQSHGFWDRKQPFASNTHTSFGTDEPIVVLTRATIKLKKAKDFWKNVPEIAQNFSNNEGFIYSIGIGEVPFLKQATISIWRNEASMKAFAYHKKQHAEVIKKTRQNKWYSEELFARFSLLGYSGKLPDSFSKLP
jgi:hypothetical protein